MSRYDARFFFPDGSGTSRSTFASFRATQRVNAAGAYQLEFLTDDDIELPNGAMLALFRFDEVYDTAPHVVFHGFHRREEDTRRRRVTLVDNSVSAEVREFTSHGTDLTGVLARAYVSYPKLDRGLITDDAARAAWLLVRRNMGPGALTERGRYANNDLSSVLRVDPEPQLSGVTYENDNAGRNLLVALRDVASIALDAGVPLLYRVDQVDSDYLFKFSVVTAPDKTINNTDGNVPILLSVATGTADEITRVVDRAVAPSRVIVTNNGSHVVSERTSIEPFNRQELIRSDGSETSLTQLRSTADALLASMRIRGQFAVKLNLANVQLFTNLELGDLATIEFKGKQHKVWVTQLSIDVKPDGQSITIIVTNIT